MFRLADKWNVRVHNGFVSFPYRRDTLLAAVPCVDYVENIMCRFFSFSPSEEYIPLYPTWASMRNEAVRALNQARHLRLHNPTPWYMTKFMPLTRGSARWRQDKPGDDVPSRVHAAVMELRYGDMTAGIVTRACIALLMS